MSEPLNLKIKALSGETLEVQISKLVRFIPLQTLTIVQASVSDLKQKLGKMTGNDSKDIRVIYKAKNMNDDDNVVDYGKLRDKYLTCDLCIVTEQNAVLHMVLNEIPKQASAPQMPQMPGMPAGLQQMMASMGGPGGMDLSKILGGGKGGPDIGAMMSQIQGMLPKPQVVQGPVPRVALAQDQKTEGQMRAFKDSVKKLTGVSFTPIKRENQS